jgi:hypothetical protein
VDVVMRLAKFLLVKFCVVKFCVVKFRLVEFRLVEFYSSVPSCFPSPLGPLPLFGPSFSALPDLAEPDLAHPFVAFCLFPFLMS